VEGKMEEVKISSPGNNKRKVIAVVIFSLILVIGGITGYIYAQYKKTHITTDDAFVDGNVHTIASKVYGTVKNIYVKSNQFVKKGDILLEMDPADYDVKMKEMLAGLNSEKAKLLESEAKIITTKKQIAELDARANAIKGLYAVQEANLKQAESDMKRAESLYKEEIIPKERYEKTETGYKSSLAMVGAASEGLRYSNLSVETQRSILKQADAEKAVLQSSIKQKEAQLEASQLNYSYTKIYAPNDGYVTRKSVELGNQIQAGQPLMAIVPLDDVYVTANYKEIQIEKIKVGQKVEIKVDTYQGKIFKGTVDSIMAGTGAVFSLFPPENATGQYVKVVQRIPVKIVFDKGTDPEHVLRIGMSVVPTVIVKD